MRLSWVTVPLAITVACGAGSSSDGRSPDGGSSGQGSGTGGSSSSGRSAGYDAGYDSSVPSPAATCTLPAPLVDTLTPKTVVGSGTPASCTEAALDAAVAAGGIVTFNCGSAPTTLTVTAEVPVTVDTTIDGKNLVTLSGGKTTRIIHIASAWNVATPLLTVQNLTFIDGYTTDVLNTTATTEGGAAIFEDGGSLTVINCTFTGNQCATSGEDVSGGAINGQGIGTLIVEGSTFTGNVGSNGGAIGTQDENVTVVNSTFVGNKATGTGGNPGNGGDGGAMSYDGAMVSWTLCGDTFSNNTGTASGGAIFRVAYNDEAVNIDRCVFDGNSIGSGNAGGLYLEYATITMTGTTISHNTANFGGGIWIGHNAIANISNDTIAYNTANMGGGIWFAGGVTGKLVNVTIADNPGNGMAGGDTGVTLQNTLVDDNTEGASMMEGEVSCDHSHGGAGVNMEYPGDPSSPCTTSVIVADAQLGPLQSNGGVTQTMAPAAGSPALAKGTGCPATDQRGEPRANPCTLGAYEVQ
jgi:hypothetical protein